ncbi:SO_0444 family Cu/Zn efflux transporter [Motilimonas eburnea]|uniref:SO_0444 family Cu/Zn efflux transporter n=1 Tax=Motilimonas eburnea TaxID=1737488 RepID=UPI001E2EE5AB|nr:SO_0444 family Cu/Zn efflux transporter [Motilimonas eburnea]MCE2572759.1 SO_0444 family Cu/Zn efflux transporter [Motilimonas eburnea]
MLIANFIDLFMEAAPWMLLGLLVAGLIKESIPSDFLARHLGGKGSKATIKAAFIGAPLPLCSCGVIPAALGLRRSGASKNATTAFLVATPETGVDSVSVSYALLGPFMAIIRPIAAIVSAIVAGLLVGKEEAIFAAKGDVKQSIQHDNDTCCHSDVNQGSCCASTKQAVKSAPIQSSCCSESKVAQVDACCSSTASSKHTPNAASRTVWDKARAGTIFAATDLVRDISVWLLIGLFFAALVETYVATDFLALWADSIWAMLVMVLMSVPMYICATASTPIAAGLLMSGISPGAVLVFMMAGPATNMATLGVVFKELGQRALVAYLVGVIGMSIVFGLFTNYLVVEFNIQVAPLSAQEHTLLPTWLTVMTSIVLALLMLRVLYQKLCQRLA